MDPGEAEFWRLRAALQELFGANDEDIEQNKDLKAALTTISKVILKWRYDNIQKIRLEIRADLLNELGVSVIGKKK